MKQFINNQNQNDRDFYHKVAIISGTPLKHLSDKQRSKVEQKLSDDETYDFCRFNKETSYSTSMLNNIRKYRQQKSGNTCLHIASQYGNLHMMKYLLRNKIVDPDTRNKDDDTTLMHTLKTSTSEHFEQSVLMLAKNSNLSLKDSSKKLAYELPLAGYSKSRARVMQILKEMYLQTISQQNQ